MLHVSAVGSNKISARSLPGIWAPSNVEFAFHKTPFPESPAPANQLFVPLLAALAVFASVQRRKGFCGAPG
jgi:hypothetical protein